MASGKSKGSETLSSVQSRSTQQLWHCHSPGAKHSAPVQEAGKTQAAYMKGCVEVYAADTESLGCDENQKKN